MPAYTYEERFRLLFPASTPERPYPQIEYVLHAPDVCELRWSVFSRSKAATVAFGWTAEAAVDAVLAQVLDKTPQRG